MFIYPASPKGHPSFAEVKRMTIQYVYTRVIPWDNKVNDYKTCPSCSTIQGYLLHIKLTYMTSTETNTHTCTSEQRRL